MNKKEKKKKKKNSRNVFVSFVAYPFVWKEGRGEMGDLPNSKKFEAGEDTHLEDVEADEQVGRN